MRQRFYLLLVVLASVVLVAGCTRARVEGPGDVGIEVGRDGDYDGNHRDYERDRGRGGPPPWAPAHGYRNKQKYRYYPDGEFYFNVDRRQYVWLEAGDWKFGASLPDRLQANLGEAHVELDLDGTHPERYHDQVRRVFGGDSDRGDIPRKGRGASGKRMEHDRDDKRGGKSRGRGKSH